MEDKEKNKEIEENLKKSKITDNHINTTEKNYNNNRDIQENYKIKYAFMIDYLKNRDKRKYYNTNEYWCNILLMPTEIEFFNKISILNLLSNYYQKNRKIDLIYKLANKFDKCIDSFSTLDPIFAINSFNSAIRNLNDQTTFLYAYRYMRKIQKLIKKHIVSIKKNYINECYNGIKNDVIDFINNYKIKLTDESYFPIEEINKLKEIIDSLLIEEYNIEKDKNSPENYMNHNYLYAINKDWVLKAKFFIENFIKAKEQKNKFSFILSINLYLKEFFSFFFYPIIY